MTKKLIKASNSEIVSVLFLWHIFVLLVLCACVTL